MQREVFHPVVIVSCIALVCLAMGLAAESAKAEETEILKITQGKPVKLGPYGNVNNATLGVSRTGVIAAGVGSPGWPGWKKGHWMTYRVSNDGGETWTEPMQGHVAVRAGEEAMKRHGDNRAALLESLGRRLRDVDQSVSDCAVHVLMAYREDDAIRPMVGNFVIQMADLAAPPADRLFAVRVLGVLRSVATRQWVDIE